MTDHTLHHGTDGTTAFLVTQYADGTIHIATRSAAAGTFVAWSPPIELDEVPVLGRVAS